MADRRGISESELTKGEKLDELKTRVAVFYEGRGRKLTQDQKERVAYYKIGLAEQKMKDLMSGDPNEYWDARRNLKNVEVRMVDFVFDELRFGDSNGKDWC